MSTFFLNVPDSATRHQRERRKSDGCIVPEFISNGLRCKEKKKLSREQRDASREKSGDPGGKQKKLRKFFPSHLDSNLIEVLRRNYDLVSALADIESNEERTVTPTKMKGPIPRIETDDSPRPLILRQHNPYKYNEYESSSISSAESAGCPEETPCTRWTWIKREVRFFLLDLVDALESPGEAKPSINIENSKLSAIALKRDLKRCYTSLHPFIEVAAALYDLLLWKNPVSTLLLTLVYFFSIVRGWTASLVLLLLLFQLSLNYLNAVKNIDIGLSFLPRKDVPHPRFDISGAQLIFDIAKFAQHLLRFSADFFEKLHNLLTWKEERVTWKFYYLVIYWLVLSMVFNTGTCLGMCGLTLGIRIFITTYLFDRFPRLRSRLDTFGWFYRNLPIKNPQSPINVPKIDEERCITPSGSARRNTMCGEMFTSRLGSNFNLEKGGLINTPTISTDTETNIRLAECGSFSQNSLSDGRDEKDDSSTEEDPMIDNVVAFRSCVMNEKDKLFPKGISTGILYLTDAALIFRTRSTSDDRAPLMALFHDVISVKKIQSLSSMSLIAGTRKGIEVMIAGRRKPLQFIGVAQRDEFVNHIEEMCMRAQASTHFIVD